jgi:hypothetical protein
MANAGFEKSKRDRSEKTAEVMVLEARAVLAAYLPPDSGITAKECVSELLAIFEDPDHPWFETQELNRPS